MNKEDINKLYEEKAIGVFPFISKHRVTILEKGYYSKKKSNYRGISYVFDEFKDTYKTLLLGYFYVPEDYIIIPEGIHLSSGKEDLINRYVKKGFQMISSAPSLSPISFEKNTPEYKAALDSHNEFKTK